MSAKWQWEDDYGWQDYSAQDEALLETAFQQRLPKQSVCNGCVSLCELASLFDLEPLFLVLYVEKLTFKAVFCDFRLDHDLFRAYEVTLSYDNNKSHVQRNIYTRFKRNVKRIDSVPSTVAPVKKKSKAKITPVAPPSPLPVVIAIDNDEEFYSDQDDYVAPAPVKAKKVLKTAVQIDLPPVAIAAPSSASPVWEYYDNGKSQWVSLPPALTKMVEGLSKKSALFSIAVPGVGGFQVNLADMSMKATAPNQDTKIKRTPALTTTSISPVLPAESSSPPSGKVSKKKKEPEEEAFEVDADLVNRCKKATSWKVLSSAKDQAKLNDSKCVICYDDFADGRRVVHLSKCGTHYFHENCIAASFKPGFICCPVCQTIYGVRVGTQPKGTMKVSTSNGHPLPGYEKYGTITIQYHFNDGTQGPQHPSPGLPYYGTSRSAYLPDSPEGRKVLKLLQLAFDRALVFTIGTSVTTGATDCVIWNGIHHKTSTHGGSSNFGYPDETYLQRVTEELEAKGVTLD